MVDFRHSNPGYTTYPPSVLVVEDSPARARKLKQKLEECGCRVHQTDGSASSLAKARQKYFELIVFDAQQLEGDDLAACKRLKTDPELASVPLVVLTSHELAEEAINRLKANCPVCYLSEEACAESTLLQIIEHTHYMTQRYM